MLKCNLKIILLVLLVNYIVSTYAVVETIHPHIGNIQQSFVEQAKTRLSNIYDINMPLTGKINRIPVKEGDKVERGQIIAIVDQQPLLQSREQLQARKKTFYALYDLQRKTVGRRGRLAKRGFIDKQSLDEAIGQRDAWLAQVAETEANLKVAEYNLNESVMRSPITGIVLNRYIQGDTWLTMGTPLLKLGNINDLEVICDVLSQEAQKLKIGDRVLLSSEGNLLTITGKVIQIYPAGFTKKSSLGVDEQRVNVIISIPDTVKASLGVGYRLQAEFFVSKIEKNVFLVPRFSVLKDNQNNYYVFKVVNSRLQKQIVKIGIMTDSEVSILDGVNDKDIIIAQPTADMRSRMKI